MASKLLLSIFSLLFLLIVGDCISTYYCLSASTEVYTIQEANPFTGWLIQNLGLTQGLALIAIVKTASLIPLYLWAMQTPACYRMASIGAIGAVLIAGYVNYNNWSIYFAISN